MRIAIVTTIISAMMLAGCSNATTTEAPAKTEPVVEYKIDGSNENAFKASLIPIIARMNEAERKNFMNDITTIAKSEALRLTLMKAADKSATNKEKLKADVLAASWKTFDGMTAAQVRAKAEELRASNPSTAKDSESKK